MAQNFGPGIQGGVVLIDPATGEPYRASGGSDGGGGGTTNAVLSDTTAAYSYIGVAPAGTAVEDEIWYVTRIPLSNPNTPLHATGAWTDRTTLTYS